MSYAIVINLDYENRSHRVCAGLWQRISQLMTRAGFRHDGRTFKTSMPSAGAIAVARSVMRDLERQCEQEGIATYRYIRDFYGYDADSTTNLLLPPVDSIEVREERVSTG